MDQRLFDAARTGDVVALHALLDEDPLILDKISLTEFAETPLHVAALAGKTEIAKEIITLMPSFARELNKDGFAPMHVASARGHVEMVMELLKIDTDCSLCLQRDKIGRIPLHYAVVKGRIVIIEKLVSHCSESLQEVTALGETVLHLAVKNSQFGALKVVLERLERHECFESLMSTKDNQGKGKTIVELAEAAKQVQVLELLKEYQNSDENNDASAKGAGNDDEIMEADQHPIDISSDSGTDDRQDDKQESKEQGKKKSGKFEMDNLVLVAAVLIATVTYQAALTPPSTIWKEGINLNARCIFNRSSMTDSSKKRKQDCPAFIYYCFMICNTAGFCSSVLLIVIVTLRYDYLPLRLLTSGINWLLFDYMALICGLSPDYYSACFLLFVPPSIAFAHIYFLAFLREVFKNRRNNPQSVVQAIRKIIERQEIIPRHIKKQIVS